LGRHCNRWGITLEVPSAAPQPDQADVERRGEGTGVANSLRTIWDKLTAKPAPEVTLTQEQYLRLKLGRSTSFTPHLTGLLLLLLSAALLAVAYAASSAIIEASSIASFAFGLALVLSGGTPKVNLYPANEGLRGPLLSLSRLAREKVGEFRETFLNGGEWSTLRATDSKSGAITVEPIGAAMVRDYERELGSLRGVGMDELKTWLPMMITDKLGLASGMKMSRKGNTVVTTLSRPYVRTLCIDEEMAKEVCSCMGCPLVASVGESLARALKQDVVHVSCTFDPSTQTANAIHTVVDSK